MEGTSLIRKYSSKFSKKPFEIKVRFDDAAIE
jgi:hypothetical protein